MNVTTIGIDIAKSVFQIHGVDERGVTVLTRRVSRDRFLEEMAQRSGGSRSVLVGMEACGGAHHWGRELIKLGFDVRLISPKHVKPYVRGDKTDRLDAEAICEAVSRPRMRFVAVKTLDQQSMQSLHRVRQQLIKQRTAVSNQARGLLAEHGFVTGSGVARVRQLLAEVGSGDPPGVGPLLRELAEELRDELSRLDERIGHHDKRLDGLARKDADCQKLLKVPGIGVITATALTSAVGDAKLFGGGRALSSWLGLTPKEHSSGNKRRLGGISKRGNSYLRTLMIHGARSAVWAAVKKDDAQSRWINALRERSGTNVAAVALANRNARVVWAILARQEAYRMPV